MKNTDLIEKAAQVLRNGGLVGFPTETVYGLGADATNQSAIQKIFVAKGRPKNHPLIVHLANLTQLSDWAIDISNQVYHLAKNFWPGPLTIVLKKHPAVLSDITGGQETIAVRIPNHPIAQALLKSFGKGLAAPSANKFTRVSATTAKAVAQELGSEVDLILDGGCSEIGLESTIINMSDVHPVILRPGMISVSEIEKVLGMKVHFSISNVRAPGMHKLHYAPLTKTSLKSINEIKTVFHKKKEMPIACMIFSDVSLPNNSNIICMKMSSQPKQYAHQLYQTLRHLDECHYQEILIEEVPNELEWDAIRDRLMKATGMGKNSNDLNQD